MKSIFVLLFFTAATFAESKHYRVARSQSQRQEAEPMADSEKREQTTPRSEVPYPPSGWRPSVPRFILPARLLAPTQAFGAPRNSFERPDLEYGVPSTSDVSVEPTTNADVEMTKNAIETLSTVDVTEELRNEATDDIESKVGAYYILLPDSTLQRVDYRTENDNRNMAYTARLQYRNEQPAPIYLYSSQQYIQLA